MRFHVISLPHTNTTSDFSACAYTEKVRKFCNMMKSRGHEVFLYAGEKNEADVTEHIACLSEKQRKAAVGKDHYTQASFDYNLPHWVNFNNNAIQAIKKRIQKKDFVCLIGGLAQKQVGDAFPAHQVVEFGIGYGGSYAKYRVFESYAWMHTTYGVQQEDRNAHNIDGQWYHDVIPNFFEVEQFPLAEKKDDYYLFIGRLTDRKGFSIAAEVCHALGKRLLIAGQGTPPAYGEYVGVVGPKKRGELMSKAIATFVPTIYIEPFGGVTVESMLCGTPIITTDWGAFPEINVQGVTGYRCRTFAEFMSAAEMVKSLDPKAIRQYAIDKYSMATVGEMYERYFQRLLTLWGDGWYTKLGEYKNGPTKKITSSNKSSKTPAG